MKVTILIPAYNEADRIGDTLRGLCMMAEAIDFSDNSSCDIWVIDDHSTDQTATVVNAFIESGNRTSDEQPAQRPLTRNQSSPQITLISLTDQKTAGRTASNSSHVECHHTESRGKGQALNYALKVLPTRSDIYLLVDADLGQSASELAPLIYEVAYNHADMAIGAFKQRASQAGGFGFVKRKALTGIQRLTGKSVSYLSPLSGQRALSRNAFLALTPFEDGFGVEVALTIKALWLDLAVTEVPLNLSHRYTQNDLGGILHRLKQYVEISQTLTRLKRTRASFMEAVDTEPCLPNRTHHP